jgi:hypothetical protein
VIEKLAFLKGEPDGRAPNAEDERLMQLFQNRAGLKKAHAELQDEFHLLRDKLKQQEGATFRLQEQMDALGDLLADPQTGHSALVFYQLRGLWKVCNQLLLKFARELRRQQEERESQKFGKEIAEERASRLAAAAIVIAEKTTAHEASCESLVALQAQWRRSGAFWHFLKRRRLKGEIDAGRNVAAAAAAARDEAQARHEAISTEAAAEFAGLSLESRRAINLAAIAYAQILCEKLVGGGLAARAKEAVARRVQEMSFGAPADCEAHMSQIQRAAAQLGGVRESAATIKTMCDSLRAVCQYRNEADTVPTADSIATAQVSGVLQDGSKATPAQRWDVLADDYWDLYSVLLR